MFSWVIVIRSCRDDYSRTLHISTSFSYNADFCCDKINNEQDRWGDVWSGLLLGYARPLFTVSQTQTNYNLNYLRSINPGRHLTGKRCRSTCPCRFALRFFNWFSISFAFGFLIVIPVLKITWLRNRQIFSDTLPSENLLYGLRGRHDEESNLRTSMWRSYSSSIFIPQSS